MRKLTTVFALAAVAALAVGCAGPERKLGRGINNMTEFVRLGEIRRSMEQTAMWDNNDAAYTTGFIAGFNRSVARTFVGAYEVLTFPFPGYDPYLMPENPVYPDNYKPSLVSSPTFDHDSNLGFGGGEVAPGIGGSRFRIFDN